MISLGRAVGIVLVLISLLPVAALFATYWVWARHMYTVGFSADAHAVTTLAALAVGEVIMLAIGIYLLRRSR
jgi:heme/copper-type cytochrome/quinol oxidase subunit 1